ncbi:MAG: hypothetical protein DRO07_03205 [Candidatus Iainarchaeum archaeon]|uniref:ATP-grasp domain-containing protein n=1 Tax=Candidatus Iainarchaeum sp. TaxID=3101447 RepID=A0A497JHY3_9ARCH|nr:MAG: hypothetical protein DRO07_03205 [Candidatus Diapherotrites archaeon]
MTEPAEIAKIIAKHREKCKIASCFMCKSKIGEIEKILNGASVPNFVSVEEAMKALHACKKYLELKDSGKSYMSYDVRKAVEFIESVEKDKLSLYESIYALKLAGINVVSYGIAEAQKDAAKIASSIGYPVILKAVTESAEHKTELGLVSARIDNEIELRRAWKQLRKHTKNGKIMVQKFIKGVEFIAGSTYDEQFGNLIAFGLGGIFVELFNDVSFRIAPLAREDVLEMIAETKAAKLLSGFRGIRVSATSIYETLLRLSAFVESTAIKELDINPLICNEHACFAVDARIAKR